MDAVKQSQLQDIIEAAVQACGYELLGCEFHHSSQRALLRVYLDKPQGITIDDCEIASRQIGLALDVEDTLQQRYTLEVSSPGLDRPLFKLAHFQKYVGSCIKIKLTIPINKQKNFTGILTKIEGEQIYIESDQKEIAVGFADIEKARLVPQFD